MGEPARRFFNIRLDPRLAVAMREWDDKMFAMRRVWLESANMISTLKEAHLVICAKQAKRISRDLKIQIATGELFMNMLRIHAEQHPVLEGEMAAEIFRQYSNIVIQYYFWSSEGDMRTTLLTEMLDEYQQLIRSAVEASGTLEDCDCEPAAEEGN